jgi:hypothetical protein
MAFFSGALFHSLTAALAQALQALRRAVELERGENSSGFFSMPHLVQVFMGRLFKEKGPGLNKPRPY